MGNQMRWGWMRSFSFGCLSRGVQRVTAAAMMVMGGWCTAMAAGDPSIYGQWSNPIDAQIIAIHVSLLPTGNVLYWQGGTNHGPLHSQIRIWDPITGEVRIPGLTDDNIFCSGHAFTPDGELLVAGGHIINDVGLESATLYNPFTNVWTRTANMNAGRWYPTNTTLPNGDMLVVSGTFKEGIDGLNLLPQVWQKATGTWRDLNNAQRRMPLYPFMFVAPNGKVFSSGPNQNTSYLDTTGQGAWKSVTNTGGDPHFQGSAVMYDDGKIMVVGGGIYNAAPNNTAEIIDLNAASPKWKFTSPMAHARHYLNAVLMPDGNVLVTGGTSSAGVDATGAVRVPELWTPTTGQWSSMAPMQINRLYHSTALLLPDGRVLVGGSGAPAASGEINRKDFEIYSPPYLFKGARPTITAAPSTVIYGEPFSVQTPDADKITHVNWIRLPSVTHGFDQNQRMNHLSFSRASGSLSITAPLNANLSPPGHYMLFILNGSGVPSVARIVQVGPAPLNYPLTVTMAGTGSGTVTSSPAGILCPLICLSNFTEGQSVTLTATADTGSTFLGWSGPDAAECTAGPVLMTASKSCTATFDVPTTEFVDHFNRSNNTVLGVNWVERGGDFEIFNDQLKLVSRGDLGLARITPPLTSADYSVEARLMNATAYLEWFGIFGRGLNFGAEDADFYAAFLNKSLVALYKRISGSWIFLGSISDVVVADGDVIKLDMQGTTIKLFYNGVQKLSVVDDSLTSAGYAGVSIGTGSAKTGHLWDDFMVLMGIHNILTVTKSGTGTGTVVSLSAGIDCGVDCTAPYPGGTSVALTAAPATGSVFAAWSNDCTGTTSPIMVMMDANRTCTATFTSTAKPTLTVIKTLIPITDTGLFNLRMNGVIKATDVGNNGTTGTVIRNPGIVTVDETSGTGASLANYIRVVGGDCATNGTVTLAMGENKTCTITNTRKPTLTVIKTLIPTTDTGLFNLRMNGVIKATNVGNNGTTGTVIRTPGIVTVSETSGTGTNLANYMRVIGGDCAADGTVTLAPGDNKTCTITNTRKSTLTVNKTLIPTTDTGLFNLRMNGVIKATNVGNNGTTGTVIRNPGIVTVSETSGTGTNLANYMRVIGGDCAADGTVTLAPGDNKTCTITNTKR